MNKNHTKTLSEFIKSYIANPDNPSLGNLIVPVIREKMRIAVNEEKQKPDTNTDDDNNLEDLANNEDLSVLEKLQNSIISDGVTFEDLQDDIFKLTKDGIKELSDIAVIDASKLQGGKTIYDYTDKIDNLVYDYKSDEDGDGEPITEFFTAVKIKNEDEAVEKVFYVTQESGAITGVVEVAESTDDDDENKENEDNNELSNDDSNTDSSGENTESLDDLNSSSDGTTTEDDDTVTSDETKK